MDATNIDRSEVFKAYNLHMIQYVRSLSVGVKRRMFARIARLTDEGMSIADISRRVHTESGLMYGEFCLYYVAWLRRWV